MLDNNLLTKDTDKFGGKSREITADINCQLYDLVVSEFESKNNLGYTWESDMYIIHEDDIIGYQFGDDEKDKLFLN